MSGPLRIRNSPSPNHGPRRGGGRPRLVILHATCMESCAAAEERLKDPVPEVSAHWLISAEGEAIAMVDEGRRAWHAGRAAWGPWEDVNSWSVGIELDNPGPLSGHPPFPPAQMEALLALLAAIRARHGIGPEGVLAHSDVAPGRKDDPGPAFDWRPLVAAGHAAGSAAEASGPWDRDAALAALRRCGGRPEPGAEDAALESARRRLDPESPAPGPRLLARLRDLAARHPAPVSLDTPLLDTPLLDPGGGSA